ncbi:7-cyano-7-deazaguanine synthase QueC [Solwaraspora sp. WMMB335]|uniref:7-cyano-7-deazaguanine synthase QueC n=1 Tax=Solwaraspora sp. WMMB335 TaxID=3404118 RepID=UPI003B950D07
MAVDLLPPARPIGHAVAIVSGGLDSTTLAYWLRRHANGLTILSVDYGQRHRKELQFARATARVLDAAHHTADLASLGALLGGSALTDTAVAVPNGHYTDASMAITVVPNRNALLLDVAVGLATVLGADTVAFGAHGGDHAVYPDCRPEFLAAYQQMATVAGAGFLPDGFQVIAPFMAMTKTDIVALADRLAVPADSTWSCYRGGDLHCGTCGTCVERREAFALAGVADPTRYADATDAGRVG